MVNIVTRSFLGQWGSAVLDAYKANSLFVNAIIFFYFLLLILAQWNYKVTLVALLHELQVRYAAQLNKKSTQEIAVYLGKHEIPWQAALAASKVPFIATPRQFAPRYKNLLTLQRLYPLDLLAERLAGK
jgi:hypothetical protein